MSKFIACNSATHSCAHYLQCPMKFQGASPNSDTVIIKKFELDRILLMPSAVVPVKPFSCLDSSRIFVSCQKEEKLCFFKKCKILCSKNFSLPHSSPIASTATLT